MLYICITLKHSNTMRNERPTNCPFYIEKFVDDYYYDAQRFLPDAIEFSKETDFLLSFETRTDAEGNATIETMWFQHKKESSLWFEYDCKKETLI